MVALEFPVIKAEMQLMQKHPFNNVHLVTHEKKELAKVKYMSVAMVARCSVRVVKFLRWSLGKV